MPILVGSSVLNRSCKSSRRKEFTLSFLFVALLLGEAAGDQTPPPITGVGRIDSLAEVRHLGAERDATVREVHVEEGQVVSAGQLLVSLHCEELEAELEVARSRLKVSEAELEIANAPARPADVKANQALLAAAEFSLAERKLYLERREKLADQGYVSSQEIDSVRLEVEQGREAVVHLKHSLEKIIEGQRQEERFRAQTLVELRRNAVRRAAVSVGKCLVNSPIDGTVLRILKHPGEYLSASRGEVVMVVADLSQLAVRAEVFESDVSRLHIGAPARVWINGEDHFYNGSVTSMSRLTGRREARTYDPSDTFDREVVEVTLEGFGDLPAILGLRVVTEISVP